MASARRRHCMTPASHGHLFSYRYFKHSNKAPSRAAARTHGCPITDAALLRSRGKCRRHSKQPRRAAPVQGSVSLKNLYIHMNPHTCISTSSATRYAPLRRGRRCWVADVLRRTSLAVIKYSSRSTYIVLVLPDLCAVSNAWTRRRASRSNAASVKISGVRSSSKVSALFKISVRE